jgi:hypothetical protein
MQGSVKVVLPIFIVPLYLSLSSGVRRHEGVFSKLLSVGRELARVGCSLVGACSTTDERPEAGSLPGLDWARLAF